MTKKLISFDDAAEGLGLPAQVGQRIVDQTENIVVEMSGGLMSRGEASPNMIDPDAMTHGVSLNEDGTLSSNNTRATTGFIPVDPSTDYVWSHDGDLFEGQDVIYQRYAADKSPIGGLAVSSTFATTSLTAYVRGSIRNQFLPVSQLEMGTTPTPFHPYGGEIPSGLVTILEDLDARISAGTPGTASPTMISRPDGGLVWEEMPHQVRRIATAYDGNLYAYKRVDGNTVLCRSTDSGETFEPGFPPSATPSGPRGVMTVTVWEDGSVVVIVDDGRIYRASSFTETPALVYQTSTGNTVDQLPTATYSDGVAKRYMFMGEYDHTTSKKLMYYSLDAGNTWDVFKEGGTLNTGNNHWHSVEYDPYRDAVWVSEGDGDNSKVSVTFDWGSTWQHAPGNHPTAMFAFPDRVVMGRDKSGIPPGITETTGLDPLTLSDALTFREDRGSFHFYPNRTRWNKKDDTYYMLFPAWHEDDSEAYIFATGDGGDTWHLVSRSADAGQGLVGVDRGGYLFATPNDSIDAPLFRAKAVDWYTARG